MRIVPPDSKSKRARFADWLELLALTSDAGEAPLSSIRSVLRIELDDRVRASELQIDADDEGEPEITDRATEDFEERIIEELSFREEIIGNAYPFEIVANAKGFPRALKRRDDIMEPASGRLFYVFCLLDSALRDKIIIVPTVKGKKKKSDADLVQTMGDVFQICSCLAIGGYLGLEVVSFGFPRAKGDAFLPALQGVWEQYGSFEVIRNIPHGFDDKLKDGGVDIIAWRHFNDGYAATMMMFVQVASGLGWKDKDVAGDVKSIKKWFSGAGFEYFMPAICIPFPLWFDLDEPAKSNAGDTIDFYTGVQRRYVYREGKFGIIFDRGRISNACAEVMNGDDARRAKVDGAKEVHKVKDWVSSVMKSLIETRVAA